MDEIGIEKVVVYEKYGNKWAPVFSFKGGSTSGHVSYTENFEYDGDSGTEYLIEATVFAENDDGYDSGVVSGTVTAK